MAVDVFYAGFQDGFLSSSVPGGSARLVKQTLFRTLCCDRIEKVRGFVYASL